MNELQRLLGDELYRQMSERLDGRELLIDDGKLIPKHRFDCVNLSLREHKALVEKLRAEIDELKAILKETSEIRLRCDAAEAELAIHDLLFRSRARNITAVRSMLKTEGLYNNKLTDSVKRQIRRIRASDPYLFEDGALYRLVPYQSHREEKNT